MFVGMEATEAEVDMARGCSSAGSCRCASQAGGRDAGRIAPLDAAATLRALRTLRRDAQELAAGYEPGVLAAAEVKEALEETSTLSKVASVLVSLTAAQVQSTGAYRDSSATSAAEAVARATGASTAQAKDRLASSRALDDLPAVDRAARQGKLSPDQVSLVAKGATADPTKEEELLKAAEGGSIGELRDTVARTVANADPDPEVTRRRIHERRSLRTFTDAGGAFHLHFEDTADIGARIMGVLRPISDRIFDDARKDGRQEHHWAYAADALVEAVCGGAHAETGKSGASKPKFILRLNEAALIRTPGEGEEVCDIPGFGPVPASVVEELMALENPFWSAILCRGHDVATVAHLGRAPNAYQLTALQWSYPTCAVKGCANTLGLQHDHEEDWAATHVTSLRHLDDLCVRHHRMKTTQGWRLVEGTGKRDFVPPGDPRHPGHPKHTGSARAGGGAEERASARRTPAKRGAGTARAGP